MAARKTRKSAKRVSAKDAVAPRSSRLIADALPLRTIFVVVGVVGLAALGVALFGPRRFRDEIVRPISAATFVPLAAAVTPQADRVWAETRPWRDRVARILASINTDEVRERVAEQLKEWVDRFR
jgi:hypothetical protein